MEEVKSLLCTRCGSHHLEKISENEFKCQSCDAVITKEKALDFEVQYRKLQKEGKDFDIANLRSLVRKSLEGHIDKNSLVKYSQDILRILPGDVLSLFYIKFANRISYPTDYEYYLGLLLKEATITEIDEIIDIIITNARFREKEQIINIINKFYKGDLQKQEQLEKALKQRTKEIDLFSDVPRDIFICWSSSDKDKADEILTELENDGNTCWISSRNIPWDSDNYWTNITKAIKSCEIFLCLNSINTMQSSDCRKEIEIANSLGKTKKIEYKLDDAHDITLFKNFFTGQWITNINDLLDKVYSLKHKEENEYREAIKLLLAKEYVKAKESFESIKGYKDTNEYLDICNSLIKAENLINGKMYSEAKERLISLNSGLSSSNSSNVFLLVKELMHKCDDLFTQEEIESAEINLKMGLFIPAEEIYKRLVIKYKSNYRIWYGYLESVSRNFTSNKNESIKAIYENAIKFVPNNDEKKKLMEKCKSLFTESTKSNSEFVEGNKDEEELAYAEEVRKKIAEETRKKILAEKNKDEEERKKKEKEEELAYAEEVRKKIAEETRKKLEKEYKEKQTKIVCNDHLEYRKFLNKGFTEDQLVLEDPKEINNLAFDYEIGRGVSKNISKALQLYQLSSQKGDKYGTNKLGLCYEYGNGVDIDYKKAYECYFKAYNQGNYASCGNLARLYKNGFGVIKDEKKAYELYMIGAEHGDEDSMYNLGMCYQLGDGCKVNMKKALEWYKKAENFCFGAAAYNAGQMYEYGRGVKKNIKEAIRLYEKAASLGNSRASERLKTLK